MKQKIWYFRKNQSGWHEVYAQQVDQLRLKTNAKKSMQQRLLGQTTVDAPSAVSVIEQY